MIRAHSILSWAGVATGLVLAGSLAIISGAPDQETPPAASQQKPAPPPTDAGPPAIGPKVVLEGGDEDDRLVGTDANEWFLAGKGNDTIIGGRGRDAIDAGDGEDNVDGGPDNDVIDGGAGNDTLRGGDGDDVIDGGDDDDVIDGGGGNDNADGGDGNDVLRGGAGDDWLAGADGDDSLSGGAGGDRLYGNDGTDTLSGGAGNDQLFGGEGDDGLIGDAGDDFLDGGQGDDVLRGGPGNDALLGSHGNDTLDGGADHDTLFGGDGRDTVNGSAGSDWLMGGAGADFVTGGDGDDLIVLRAGDVPAGDTEVIDGSGGTDVLILNGFSVRDAPTAGALDDSLSRGTYRLTGVERVEYTHLLTLGSGTSRPESVVLVNPSADPATARVAFFAADGAPVAATPGTVTIPPLGTARLTVPSDTKAPAAAAQLFATRPLGAPEQLLVDSVVIPVVDDAMTTTGALIVNSIFRSRIKITLRLAAGQEAANGATEFELAPYAQRVVFVRDLFPGLGNFQGAVTIEGGLDRPQEGGPIAVTPLQRRGDVVVAGPAAIRANPPRAAAPLTFARFLSGGDAPSTIILVNPMLASRARGTVSFYDQDGRPLPVVINKQPAAASVPYDLGPAGSVTFTTPAGGPMQIGLARVEPADGQIAGVLRAGGTTSRVSDAGGAAIGPAFIAPARRAAGATTEFAFTSIGGAASLQLVLRDQAGAPVADGTTKLTVPANGQIVRTLEALFPNVPATFEGTLAATSDVPIGASVTYTDGGGASPVPAVPVR